MDFPSRTASPTWSLPIGSYGWFLFLAASAGAESNPNQPLDRHYTLRTAEPLILEREYQRQVAGTGNRAYLFPRPCLSLADSSRVCGEEGPIAGRLLHIRPRAETEWRYLDEHGYAAGAGVQAQAGSGPLAMAVDARMYFELHEDPLHPSFDREQVDRQDEETSGSLAYTSYSRYRAEFSYTWAWGRLSAGRDAAHWGPGLHNNLVLHRDAIPFNQVSFSSSYGPFNVRTLYGRLAVEGDRIFSTRPDSRSLYAHRYEWNAGRYLLLAVSETMLLYNHEEPFAFLPLIPLFIAKGDGWERMNNGNIAADASFRWPGLFSLYTEFLVDDIQSPTSLFDDQWGNKWAVMAGTHWIRELGPISGGAVLEYARLEPWVYTHYQPATAQSVNLGHPLGHASGPNSQTLTAAAYATRGKAWFFSLRSDLVWKGTDLGSSLQDSRPPEDNFTKVFLAGADEPQLRLQASFARNWGAWGVEAAAGREGEGTRLRLGARYQP